MMDLPLEMHEVPLADVGGPVEEDPAAALMERARCGDEGAFEALYRSHVGRVHGLCLRLTADPEQAEELTQQVFVRAFETLPRFRGIGRWSAWLRRVALNLVASEWRRRRRWAPWIVVEEPERLQRVGDLRAFPGRATADLDLERSIAALPPQARTVFVLHDVEGYGHGEIARLTGMAVGTSKAHLHRARRLLREALGR